jgi:hypothetical protein
MWLRVIQRILRSPDTGESTPVNFFHDTTALVTRRAKYLTQKNMNHLLRLTCKLRPDMYFGYRAVDIGTHSIRSGAAMALFMADEQPHKIMILGRWLSDAFMDYIRPQVQEWTSGMSTQMLRHDDFHIAPHSTGASTTNRNNKADPADPHISGDPRASRGRSNLLSSFTGSDSFSFLIPRLHLFH